MSRREILSMKPVLGLVACLLLAGCPKSDAPTESEAPQQPYAGVQLRVVIPTNLKLSDQWAPAVNDWALDNAATVETVEIDFTGDTSVWLKELRGGPTSLVVLPTTQIGELVGTALATTIPPSLIEAEVIEWHQIPPDVRSTLDMLGEAPAFVTATCPTPVIVVRSDLLEAAGRTAPTTWSEYDRLVEDLAEWAPDHVAVEPRAEQSLPTLFFARAISGARHPAGLSVELDVSDGTPLIASPPYVRALTEMQALAPHLATEVRSMSPADCLSALADGRAAMGIVWETDAAPLSTDKGSASVDAPKSADRGALSFVPLPGRTEVYNRDNKSWEAPPDGKPYRPTLCGFAGLSVAVTNGGNETDQSAAWDLWGLLAAYQAEGTIPALPGSSPTSTLMPAIEGIGGLTSEESREYLKVQSADQQNRWLTCEMPMLGRTQMRSELGTAIAQALDGDTKAAASLEKAQSAWSDTIDDLGRTNVLNSYRLRLGLVPVAK